MSTLYAGVTKHLGITFFPNFEELILSSAQ